MAEIITQPTRKAIKKIAQVSQCARAIGLMPNPEDFALKVIGDLKIVAQRITSISTRINDILDRYASIPAEFLFESMDAILDKINDIGDYAKFAIAETTNVLSSTVSSVGEVTDAIGSAVSATTSAVLQVGGGITYAAAAMGANITLAMNGDSRTVIAGNVAKDVAKGEISIGDYDQEVENRINVESGGLESAAGAIRDWTVNTAKNTTESIDDFYNGVGKGIDNANQWINNAGAKATDFVDDKLDAVEDVANKAKQEIEKLIEKARSTFGELTKNFDETFGWISGLNVAERASSKVGDAARETLDSPVGDAIAETADAVANFIKNFDIIKVATSIGGIAIGAGAATLLMDMFPQIDVDRILKSVISGIDNIKIDKITELYNNKHYENEPDLLEVPDVPWRLSKDDLEKYTADAYNEYLEQFGEVNDQLRMEMQNKLQNAQTRAERTEIRKENQEKMRENKSALKAMRKIRRDAIKAKQVEKYKGFLKIELDYLKRDCQNLKTSIKNEWDSMMQQYKDAISEIVKFFTVEGSGGSEAIDRCCDRINDDAEQIVELCQSITVEITSCVAKIPVPYAIGSCFDMPVHKILAFFQEIKIILTFVKNLIRLGIDIISQLTILAKIIAGGLQSISEVVDMLKKLIGIDKIMKMIDFLIALFKPKMAEGKILIENALTPVYYGETEEFEAKVEELEGLLEDDEDGCAKGVVKEFKYTDDPYARKKYRKKTYGGKKAKDDEEIEDWLEELEAKGDREIVAYRSPILNDAADDFAGWIFYHADAYDNMKKSWRDAKKRRRNKLIKKAHRKNKLRNGKLVGGVSLLKSNKKFGYTKENGSYVKNSVTGYDAYFWYIKWTNDPTDCVPDFSNVEEIYDDNGNLIGVNKSFEKNVVSPVTTTANGSLVELEDGRRVFVEGQVVQTGDYVNVEGVRYRVK